MDWSVDYTDYNIIAADRRTLGGIEETLTQVVPFRSFTRR